MAAVSQAARAEFADRCSKLRADLANPDFLSSRGLGNEVALYTFCYDPGLELEARDFLARLKAEDLPCRIVEYNLYDLMLQRLDERRVLSRMDQSEKRKGRAWIKGQIDNMCPATMYVEKIAAAPREPGDVILITGVGEVFPFIRLHEIFHAIQPVVKDVPIIAMYPGYFDGRHLRLFSRMEEDHYYRAFDLI